MAARVGLEPATLRMQGTEPNTEPPRPYEESPLTQNNELDSVGCGATWTSRSALEPSVVLHAHDWNKQSRPIALSLDLVAFAAVDVIAILLPTEHGLGKTLDFDSECH